MFWGRHDHRPRAERHPRRRWCHDRSTPWTALLWKRLGGRRGRQLSSELRLVPFSRSLRPSNWQEFWQGFYYWFSGAERRSGARLNYASCRESARAEVYDAGFTLIRCRDVAPVEPVTLGGASVTPPAER